jgi:hypothetical protein
VPNLPTILNYVAAGFALGAAIMWLKSARVYMPETFSVRVSKAIGSSGLANSPDLQQLGQALKYQSKLSAIAAILAAASAVAQAFALAASRTA